MTPIAQRLLYDMNEICINTRRFFSSFTARNPIQYIGSIHLLHGGICNYFTKIPDVTI